VWQRKQQEDNTEIIIFLTTLIFICQWGFKAVGAGRGVNKVIAPGIHR